MYSFLNSIGANRLGGETTCGGETTRGKRPGGNVLGAKRLGEEIVWGRNDPDFLRVTVTLSTFRFI